MDFGRFESTVYELAQDLRYTPEGEFVARYQLQMAALIARDINIRREALRTEYMEEPSTFLIDHLQHKLGSAAIQSDAEAKRGLESLVESLTEDMQHRQKIAAWLTPIIPKMEKTQIQPRKVIKSLLNQPTLQYDLNEHELAELVLNPPEPEIKQRKPDQLSSDELEDYELTMVAEGLLRMLVDSARRRQKLTKVQMYSMPEFTSVLRVVGDVPARQTFYTAWELLVGFMEEADPSYDPFIREGKGAGCTYILEDPELAEIIWGMDDETPATDPQDSEQSEERERDFEGRIIRITKNSLVLDSRVKIPLTDEAQHTAARMLLEREAQFTGTGMLVQSVSEKIGVPRSDAEQAVRDLLQELGPNYVEKRYSKKRNKTLVRIRPHARAVLQ